MSELIGQKRSLVDKINGYHKTEETEGGREERRDARKRDNRKKSRMERRTRRTTLPPANCIIFAVPTLYFVAKLSSLTEISASPSLSVRSYSCARTSEPSQPPSPGKQSWKAVT